MKQLKSIVNNTVFPLFSGIVIGVAANKVSSHPTLSWIIITAASVVLLVYLLYRFIQLINVVKGVSYIENNRNQYCEKVAELMLNSKQFVFLKTFTGYDLLTHDSIKKALDNLSEKQDIQVDVIFTDPDSEAYRSELNCKYTQEYLKNLHSAADDSIKAHLKNSYNSYYIKEHRCLFMLVISECEAYIFFRGFNSLHASEGLLIFKICLEKTYPKLNNLILFIKNYFIQKSKKIC